MAMNPNWNELATTTLNLWGSTEFANAMSSHNPLLAMLRMKGQIITGGMGVKIVEPLMYADSDSPQVEGVADGFTEMVPSEDKGWTNSEWEWCEKRLPIAIENIKLKKQGTATQKISLVDTYKKKAVLKFNENIAGDFWRPEGAIGANGSNRRYLSSILCLFNRGGSATTDTNVSIIKGEQTFSGPGGGAAVGTNPLTNVGNIERNGPNGAFWCTPVRNPGSPTTLSLLAMNSLYQLTVRGDDSADYIVTTHDNYSNVMSILTGLQRYMTGKLAAVGFDSMTFRGAEMVADDRCPAANTFMINTDYIQYKCDTMKPTFTPVNDPWRSITGWKAEMFGQLIANNLGRMHARHANML